MLQKLRHSVPFPGIFFEADQNELFCCVAYFCGFGELNLILNDLDEISLSCDFKRNSPIQKLISEDPNTPNVDFVIVGFPFEKLGGYIQRSTAKSLPHSFRTDGPAKIAQFNHTLN